MHNVEQFPPSLFYKIEAILQYHSKICENEEETHLSGAQYCYKSVVHVPQVGPTCGIVALSMTSTLLELNNITVDDIFSTAKNMRITKQGEMFSATWLSQLAQNVWSNAIICNVDKFPSPIELVKKLSDGEALLLPYDCDRNFSPCKKNGHTAHWALVTGYLYVTPDRRSLEFSNDPPETVEASKLYMFAYHGKSRHMSIWSYQDVYESNSQLNEVGPNRSLNDYMIPDFILDDLRHKVIWIRKAETVAS